jgi:hypothetical protein
MEAFMFKYIISLLLLTCSVTAFAENVILPKNQILVTDKGIMFEIGGLLFEGNRLIYIGNGMYEVASYDHCNRCGWPVDESGRCTNQACTQNGPKERD